MAYVTPFHIITEWITCSYPHYNTSTAHQAKPWQQLLPGLMQPINILIMSGTVEAFQNKITNSSFYLEEPP